MIRHIYKQCFSCKKHKFFVRKRQVPIKGNLYANSREEFCGKCFKELKEQITKSL